MSRISVRLFAAAAEAFGASETEVTDVTDLAGVVGALAEGRPERLRAILDQCSFFIDGEHRTSLDVAVPDGARVDVLPPFAGGRDQPPIAFMPRSG